MSNFKVPKDWNRGGDTKVNPNDPYAMAEFDLNKYDRAYTDSQRKSQEKNPFGKAKTDD